MNRRQLLAGLAAATGTVATANTAARASKPQSHPLGLTGFDHMSVNAIDFDRMLSWYREVLDLELDVSWKVQALDGKRLAYLSLNGSRVVEIVAADENGTGLRPPTSFAQHFGTVGFGHLCFATDDVDRTMAAFAARGVPAFVKAETYPLDGTTYERRVAFVQDPEGNVLEFGEPLRKAS
ncbi:MAG: VOC family protein [Pseudomonadota bacterium]